jgi:hypothetical protein
MGIKNTILERSRATAGIVLVALGAWILYTRLDWAATHLNDLLTIRDASGTLGAFLVAGNRAIQGCAGCHHGILFIVIKQVLLTFWPLMLVLVGTILSPDAFRNSSTAARKKDSGTVDLRPTRSTLP